MIAEASTATELEQLCEQALKAADSTDDLEQRIAHLERAFSLAQRAVSLRKREGAVVRLF